MIDDPHDPMAGGYTPSKDIMREKYDRHWTEGQRKKMPQWIGPMVVGGVLFWVIFAWIMVAMYW